MSYILPPLRYDYDALEPVIGAETLRLHHEHHHRIYIDALNAVIADFPELHGRTIEDLLRHIAEVPDEIRAAVREYGGGHANHQLSWKVMAPPGSPGPGGILAEWIDRDFGSLQCMRDAFEGAANRLIGPGWVYLAVDPRRMRLEVLTLRNNESVLFIGKPALFAIDLWEHAYYLQYRDRKADYVREWWSVLNWPYIGERLQGICEGRRQL